MHLGYLKVCPSCTPLLILFSTLVLLLREVVRFLQSESVIRAVISSAVPILMESCSAGPSATSFGRPSPTLSPNESGFSSLVRL